MSSQAAVAASREKRTPARADAASEPPSSVGEAVGAVGAAEGEAVGAQVSVTPHQVASQPESSNALLPSLLVSFAVKPHQPRSWSKAGASANMNSRLSSSTAYISQLSKGLRGRCLDGRRTKRPHVDSAARTRAG